MGRKTLLLVLMLSFKTMKSIQFRLSLFIQYLYFIVEKARILNEEMNADNGLPGSESNIKSETGMYDLILHFSQY